MKTTDLVKVIQSILFTLHEEEAKIDIHPSEAHYDTETIVITFDKDSEEPKSLYLCGFNDEDNAKSDPTDWKEYVTMIELKDDVESSSGLYYDTGNIVPTYHKIRHYLRSEGYEVVNCLSDYF